MYREKSISYTGSAVDTSVFKSNAGNQKGIDMKNEKIDTAPSIMTSVEQGLRITYWVVRIAATLFISQASPTLLKHFLSFF